MKTHLILLFGVLFVLTLASAPVLANGAVVTNWEPPPPTYYKPAEPSPFWNYINQSDQYFSGFGQRAGAFVVIVLVEALIIFAIAKINFWPSLGISLIMNLFSAGVGLIARNPSFFIPSAWIIILLVLAVMIPLLIRLKAPWTIGFLAVASILFGSFFLSLGEQVPTPSRYLYAMLLFLPILLPFGLTLLAEPVVAGYFLSGKKLWMSMFWANVISYAVIVNLAFYFSPGMKDFRKYPGPHYVKKTGIEVPLAYDDNDYGGSGPSVYDLGG